MSHSSTLFVDGTIETLDPRIGRTDAVLIEDGRVVAHGQAAVAAAAGLSGVNTVDLGGAFAMPGLIDAHNHHALAGQIELFEFDAPPTLTLDALLDRLASHVQDLPPGEWVCGGNWGSVLFDELNSHASRQRLDAAAGGRPVVLRDDAKHNRWASSEALRRAGIDKATQDPEGGHICRVDGAPTGLLLEAAGVLVEKALRREVPMTNEQVAASSERAIGMLHSHGITAFQDAAASAQLLRALKTLDDDGRLHAWVVTSMLVNDFIFGVDPLGEGIISERDTTRTLHHRPDFVKIFLDGIPPSRTGAFLEPYAPDACGHVTSGEPTMTQAELTGWMRRAAERGIGAKIHCTGDAAVRMVLDAAQHLRGEGFSETRWHIAHGQFIAPVDRPRLAELDVTAEISPAIWHPGVIPDAIAQVRMGAEGRQLHPNRTLLDLGTRVVGGSDWPVSVSPAVWPVISALVTREDPDDPSRGALWVEEGITLDEAVAAYTTASAEALGISDVAGSLGIGRSGDLAVLSEDPWAIDIRQVAGIRTQQTWFAGRKVFDACAEQQPI